MRDKKYERQLFLVKEETMSPLSQKHNLAHI